MKDQKNKLKPKRETKQQRQDRLKKENELQELRETVQLLKAENAKLTLERNNSALRAREQQVAFRVKLSIANSVHRFNQVGRVAVVEKHKKNW